MSELKFISNNKIKMTAAALLELNYPELISKKYDCDFFIEVDGKTFFACGGDTFALMEFLQSVVRWIYRTDDLYYHAIETEDNPMISFIREEDGLYSIHSPWQEFECKEHFTLDQLKAVLDLAGIQLAADENETVIKKEDYRYSVEIEKTKEYYQTHIRCGCSPCRNFYRQIKNTLPKVADWLNDFGVDIERPDETMWWQNDDNTISYSACYTVSGEVLQYGKYEFDFYDNLFVSASITDPHDIGGYFPNEQKEEYFGIIFEDIVLPWALDEPLPEENNAKKTMKQIVQKPQSLLNKIKSWFQ